MRALLIEPLQRDVPVPSAEDKSSAFVDLPRDVPVPSCEARSSQFNPPRVASRGSLAQESVLAMRGVADRDARTIGLAAMRRVAPVGVLMIGVLIVGVVGCGGRAAKKTMPSSAMPTPAIAVGACGTPDHDGVVNAQAGLVRLERADRDLNNDGQDEVVTVDRSMCNSSGNCHWNVFAPAPPSEGCQRFLGTISGRALQVATDDKPSDGGYVPVRAFWQQSEGRVLVQAYRFSAGGYRLVDVLMCQQGDGDALHCEEQSAK